MRDLPIVENMFMGNLIGNGVIVNKKKMVEEARKIFEDFGTDIDPNAMLFTLSPAMMQIVEIAKAVLLHTRVLILDEPTAPLTVKEVDILFNIIRKLKASGVAIIYISHLAPLYLDFLFTGERDFRSTLAPDVHDGGGYVSPSDKDGYIVH